MCPKLELGRWCHYYIKAAYIIPFHFSKRQNVESQILKILRLSWNAFKKYFKKDNKNLIFDQYLMNFILIFSKWLSLTILGKKCIKCGCVKLRAHCLLTKGMLVLSYLYLMMIWKKAQSSRTIMDLRPFYQMIQRTIGVFDISTRQTSSVLCGDTHNQLLKGHEYDLATIGPKRHLEGNQNE